MPAPSKLILRVKNKRLSAFIIDLDIIEPYDDMVCKSCAPTKTKMKYQAVVTVPAKGGNDWYSIYQCGRCARQWATYRFVPDGAKERE
jgi:hypothetical protein